MTSRPVGLDLTTFPRYVWYGVVHMPDTFTRLVSGNKLSADDVPSVVVVGTVLLTWASVLVYRVEVSLRRRAVRA